MKLRFIFPMVGSLLVAAAGCSPPSPKAVPATPAEIGAEVQASKAPLTLVHAWATWCPPCVKEFPELVKIHREFSEQGLGLILISADEPTDVGKVEDFLAQQNSPVDSLVTTELSQGFIETLSPNWGGALPASFFFIGGRLVAEWEGMRSFAQYEETIRQLMEGGQNE